MDSAASQGRASKAPNQTKVTPYWHWWHPEKSIIDIILSFIISLLIPIPNKFPNTEQATDVLVSYITKSRKSFAGLIEMQMKSGGSFYRIWSKLVDQDIVEVTLEIPRRDALLDQWGISPKERKHVKLPDKNTVSVLVAFPISLLPNTLKANTKSLKSGALELDQNIGEKCVSDILQAMNALPVFLHAHGGGYTVGTPQASEIVTELLKHHTTIGEKPKSFIYASIKYSLAPEHPFPVAPLEATSVSAWFLERAGPNTVHLAGISAGAGLMLSVYAGILRSSIQERPASVIALCPMLSPACDTLSFLENETSSISAPVQWLRWSYRCYLQMPMESVDDVGSTMTSNRRVWEESIWYSSALRELVEPNEWICKNGTPGDVRIVVTTNSADPLRDGGVSFTEDVGDVVHLRHKGSHFIGTMVNQKNMAALREALYNTVFGA